jgi:hypothetical protein
LGLATLEAWTQLSDAEQLDWLAFDWRRQEQRRDLRQHANKLVKDGKFWDSMAYLMLMLQTDE